MPHHARGTTRYQCLITIALLWTVLCDSVICRAQEPALQQREAVLAEVPLHPDEAGVVVAARCLDGEHLLYLDTGCSALVLDHSFREKLGPALKPVTGQAAFGTVSTTLHRAPDISIGRVTFAGSGRAACLDLTLFREAIGLPMIGLVGIDSIEKHVVELDLTGRKLCILARVPAEVEENGERVRMYRTEQGWRVPGGVAGVTSARFLIDTGADHSLSLSEATFDRLHAGGMLRDCREIGVATLAGEATTREGELQRFALGQFEHEGLLAERGRTTSIGTAYLRRYTAVFDFPGRYLYLRPSPAFESPEKGNDKSGLRIIRREKDTLVHQCLPNSPADGAGFEKGDRLMQLNGEPVETLSLEALRETLRHADEMVEITTARGEQKFTRKITLREYRKLIPPPAEK